MSFKKIIALSLNPALDITVNTDHFVLGEENYVINEQYDPTGKAVNAARVFRRFDLPVEIVMLIGEYNSQRILTRLEREGIPVEAVMVPGFTRENITVCSGGIAPTRIIRPGFVVDEIHISKIKQALMAAMSEKSLIIVSGKLPEGISPQRFASLCKFIEEKNMPLVLDCSSVSLEQIEIIRPWLIKPNEDEFRKFTGMGCDSNEEIVKGIKILHDAGVRHVILSLGARGLIHSDSKSIIRAEVPNIELISPVGAGDSCLAGFITGVYNGNDRASTVRLAAALGTAACLSEGTAPPKSMTVVSMSESIRLTEEKL